MHESRDFAEECSIFLEHSFSISSTLLYPLFEFGLGGATDIVSIRRAEISERDDVLPIALTRFFFVNYQSIERHSGVPVESLASQ